MLQCDGLDRLPPCTCDMAATVWTNAESTKDCPGRITHLKSDSSSRVQADRCASSMLTSSRVCQHGEGAVVDFEVVVLRAVLGPICQRRRLLDSITVSVAAGAGDAVVRLGAPAPRDASFPKSLQIKGDPSS